MSQAIIAGVFALVGALATLMVQGRQQRIQTQDERLWSHRADTYVAMLQYQGSAMLEGYRGGATKEEWSVLGELTAKAEAFASNEVWNLWQESAQRADELEFYVSENWPQWSGVDGQERFGVEEKMERDPEFRKVRQARRDASKKLAERIRVELDVHRRGSVQRSWRVLSK